MNIAVWKRLFRTPYGVVLGLCILLQGLVIAISSPLMPIVISDRIGMDKPLVTAFFLFFTLSAVVVTLVTGYLSDGMVARYKLILGGGVFAILGYLGIATATQPIHAFLSAIAIVMLGVLFPQFFAVAKTGLLADWERSDQVKGITALRTLFSLGFIFGTALGSGLTKVIDVQAIFFVVAAVAALLTAFATVVMIQIERHIVQKTTEAVKPDQSKPTVTIALPLSALIVPLLAMIILQGAESTRTYFLSLVTFQFFKDASIAPLLFGITATTELVTMSLLGNIASKIGAKNAIAFGALVGAFYFVVQSLTQSLPILYAVQVVYAIFVAALEGVGLAYIQGLLAHRAGMGGSLYMAVMNIGSLVGILTPLLVAGYSPAVFIIPAILCVVGAILLFIGDRTAQIERHLQEAMNQKAVAHAFATAETER